MYFRNAFRVVATISLTLCLALTQGSFGIPSFDGSTGWINSPRLYERDMLGKVVLVDFWEYTCVNCLRTLPYLRTWYQRYHDDGLLIIGVHTPEFEFSGDRNNVATAVHRLGIEWPVALDTDHAIWQNFGNRSWPNEYLFDQDGRLVDTVSGEGRYQQTEAKIQSLLKAKNSKLDLPPVMALLPQDDYTKPGAVCYLHTPELLMSQTSIADADKSDDRKRESMYADAGAPHADGRIYLQGMWRLPGESAVPTRTSAYLAMRYHAIEVEGVLEPPRGGPARVDVTQDGAPVPKVDAGSDLRYDSDGSTYVIVDAPRAYQIVMNAKMAFHELRLAPNAPGIGFYSFAFESCEATT